MLTPQARVYNYSFAQMPAGTQVHARFYFQPMNGGINGASPVGDSVLIGEDILGPIPPFNDSGDTLNWVLASTTFDTSKYSQTENGGAYLIFWVVVWMQAPDGTLVAEMPGHGLTAVPGKLKSLADVPEQCQGNGDGNCYSNNAGFYKQIFFIARPPLLWRPREKLPRSI